MVLVDSSKFLRHSSLVLCPLDRVSTIVTDDAVSDEARGLVERRRGQADRRRGARGMSARCARPAGGRRRHRQDHGQARARRPGERRDARRADAAEPGAGRAALPARRRRGALGLHRRGALRRRRAAATSPASPSPPTARRRRWSAGRDWRCRCSTTSTTDRRRSAADYDAARPPFAETLSPRLPAGLNLGAQIFWQARAFPEAFARATRDPHLSAVLGVAAVAASRRASSPRSAATPTSGRPAPGGFSSLVAPRGLAGAVPAGACRPRGCSGRCGSVAAATGRSTRRRRSSAASTIPTPRCCRGCGGPRRRSPSSRRGPGRS